MRLPQSWSALLKQRLTRLTCSYLASPEVVAASALKGRIVGPGWYQQPENTSGVIIREGDKVKKEESLITTKKALKKVINQLDNIIEVAEEKNTTPEAKTIKEIEILPGFPSKIEGELVFCDADNMNVSFTFPNSFLHPRPS